MPNAQYKTSRSCECGYSTLSMSGWCTHKKRCCYFIDSEKEQLRSSLAQKEQELLAARQRITELENFLHQQLVTAQQELRAVRKRKDRYAQQTANRVHLREPQRRAIAIRQGWKCNVCRCDLAEYDVDHIEPLCRGGQDEDANRQAVCVACHRQKTDRERVARATGEAPAEPPADPVVVG